MRTRILTVAAVALLLDGCASGISPSLRYRPVDDAGAAWRIDVVRTREVVADTFAVEIDGQTVASTTIGVMKVSNMASGRSHGHPVRLECRALAPVWTAWVNEECSVYVSDEEAGVFSF